MLIIASIGLNSTSEDKIRKIILAGADVIRYNFSHRLLSDNIEYIRRGEDIINELNAQTEIMIDLPNNKVRLGQFDSTLYTMGEGQELIIRSASYSPNCNEFVPVDVEKIGSRLHINQTITIGDGEVAFQVLEIIDDDSVKIRALNNGTIKAMRSFNAQLYFNTEDYLKYCQNILEKIKELEPDYLMLPYLGGEIHRHTINLIRSTHIATKMIIKIGHEISKQEIDDLYHDPLYRMVAIDLGELGVNMPFEKVGKFYNLINTEAKKYQKGTLVMTHLLESSMNNYIPNRSEIINLTNIVADGIKGIVLCHETSLGVRPAYVINVAKKIIAEAQKK